MMRLVIANVSKGLSGGYRKYLSRLVPLLGADRRIAELTVFVAPAARRLLDPQIPVRDWPSGPAFKREIDRIKPDVLFVPTARHVRLGRTPVVTMVRNMEPLSVPFGGNSMGEGVRNLARAWEARRASRRADRVIAVSQHVRAFLIDRWKVDPGRVGVVYHGVDPVAAGGRPRDAGQIFTAGSIRPARGLEDAIAALSLLPPDVRLTIAGRVDRGCEAYAGRLRNFAEASAVSGRIVWCGELDAAGMESAFRSAAAFVMTSRAEACPNTALEAMSAGCPIVSVDRAPMPEFFGDAAVYYPDGDVRALAERLRDTLGTPAERIRLGELGRDRARAFTWEATRDRTIAELEQALR